MGCVTFPAIPWQAVGPCPILPAAGGKTNAVLSQETDYPIPYSRSQDCFARMGAFVSLLKQAYVCHFQL